MLVTLKLDPARMQLISGFVDSYLRLNESEENIFRTELERVGLVQEEEVMEIVTSWMEKGIEQGIEREKNLVIRQLKRRVGNISDEVEAQIRSLDIDTVEALGEALLDFETEGDFNNWLDDRTGKTN